MEKNENTNQKNEKLLIDYIIELITKFLQFIFGLFTNFVTAFVKNCINDYNNKKDEGVWERMNRKNDK